MTKNIICQVIQSDLLIPYFWLVVLTDPKNISQIGSFPQVGFFGFGAWEFLSLSSSSSGHCVEHSMIDTLLTQSLYDSLLVHHEGLTSQRTDQPNDWRKIDCSKTRRAWISCLRFLVLPISRCSCPGPQNLFGGGTVFGHYWDGWVRPAVWIQYWTWRKQWIREVMKPKASKNSKQAFEISQVSQAWVGKLGRSCHIFTIR